MPDPSLITFLRTLDRLQPRELDALPVGLIQLDPWGRILQYNATEARLAELPQAPQIGKMFFSEVAPCTRVQAFYGRFVEGVRHEDLDTSFPFHFAFKQGPRNVRVRMYWSQQSRSVWVVIEPDRAGG